jgi:hypothetical protein
MSSPRRVTHPSATDTLDSTPLLPVPLGSKVPNPGPIYPGAHLSLGAAGPNPIYPASSKALELRKGDTAEDDDGNHRLVRYESVTPNGRTQCDRDERAPIGDLDGSSQPAGQLIFLGEHIINSSHIPPCGVPGGASASTRRCSIASSSDEPFVLKDSSVELIFAVTEDGTISLEVESEQADEVTHKLKLTLASLESSGSGVDVGCSG